MGVMPCTRRNCSHIMCDNYSPVYGRICNWCKEELVTIMANRMHDTAVGVIIREFLDGPPLTDFVLRRSMAATLVDDMFPDNST